MAITRFLDGPECRFALNAVRRATLLVQQVQHELVSPALTKEDRSPVTVADFVAQAVVARLLAEQFHADPLVGEEDAGELRHPDANTTLQHVTAFVKREFPAATHSDVCDWIDRGGAQPAKRFWTLDPIDGTKGFLRKEQYAVALALVVDGHVRLGVLGCPNLRAGCEEMLDGPGSLVVAAATEGTWVMPIKTDVEPVRLRVSSRSDTASARLLRSVESEHTDADKIGELAANLGVNAPPVKMDSQAKYSVLAAGGGDVLLRLLSPSKPNYREKIWDQAAGSIVVEEAGGRITDLDNKPLDFTQGRALAANRGVLATNGLLHDAVLAGLRAVST